MRQVHQRKDLTPLNGFITGWRHLWLDNVTLVVPGVLQYYVSSTTTRNEEEPMADNPFEIPQTMRDLAEQNMKQAHAAYDQLTDFMTKAMGAWMGAMPSTPGTAGLKDVQERAVAIAKQNADFELSPWSKR